MEDYYSNQTRLNATLGSSVGASSDTQIDDEIIWERFKKGDKVALTHIYRNYANDLYNYGCQITAHQEIVKDAIQDLFIEIINNKERLGKTNSIKYYLFKSLRNKLVRLLIRQSKELEGRLSSNDNFLISISPELMLINRQIDQEKKRLITAKLNELPPLQREVLLLFYYEGMKYEQIAGILGLKVKSARALVYRAIASMSKLLTPVKDQVV